MRNLTLMVLAVALVPACTSSDAPPVQGPPMLQVTSPMRGTMQPGLSTIAVTGTVAPSPDTGKAIKGVTVNGIVATVNADGAFSASIPVTSGTNFIDTIAVDVAGNKAEDMRALVTGVFKPASVTIDNAISAALSPAAFAKLGMTAGSLVAESDLGQFVAPFNPVMTSGLDNGQEDCLYAKVSVKPGLDVQTASVGIVPTTAGLAVDIDLHGVYIPLHVRYGVACYDSDTDVSVRMTRARIRGTLQVMVAGGKFDVRLVSPQVTIEGFNLSGGLPGTIIDMLHLDSTIGSVLAWAAERFMAPLVDQALRGVAVPSTTVNVLGKPLEIAVTPAGVDVDDAGAEVVMDGRLRVLGSNTQFVYTEDQFPPQRTGAGVELAVADDTLNQVLATFWSSGAMNLSIQKDLGLYDGATLQPLLPPVVTTTDDGSLALSMGDMIVDFHSGEQSMTKVAMNLQIKLKVTPNPQNNNAVKLGIDLATMKATVLDNITGVPDEGLEGLLPGMAGSMLDNMSPILGAVPLPSVAGIAVTDLRIGGDAGYVTVSGNVQ